MSKLLSIIILALVVIGYQNCGKKMSFSTDSKVSDDGAVIPIDDIDTPSDDVDDVTDDNSGEEDDGDDGGEVVDNPGDDDDDGEDGDDNDHGNHSCQRKNYICILEGAGKSQRLGYIDSKLVSQNSAPDTVCTTKRACLEIVSQKFVVKEAKASGFCGKNKHTISLSEEELSDLINE